MTMEKKLVINELEQGKELANRLINNFNHTSSVDSNETLVSEILRVYQNAIFMLSFGDDKNIRKRSSEIGSKSVFKKRKTSEKTTEKVRFFVGTEQEMASIDEGYYWRKYGQKEIHGSINPRGYFRCTHRFTQSCLAVKQVQKSDTDSSIFEVKYIGDHTCNNITSTKTMIENRVNVTADKTVITHEDLENKKNIFRTFSFSNIEIDGWESNIFPENLMEELTPATSGSGITSEIVSAPVTVENSETADSYFSFLDNIIDFGQDWSWSV